MRTCARPIRVWRPNCYNSRVDEQCACSRALLATTTAVTAMSSSSVAPWRWRGLWRVSTNSSFRRRCSARSRLGSQWVHHCPQLYACIMVCSVLIGVPSYCIYVWPFDFGLKLIRNLLTCLPFCFVLLALKIIETELEIKLTYLKLYLKENI